MERKKARRRIRWDRVMRCAFMMVLVAAYSWLCASYLDVIMHNQHQNPVYQEWNVFEMYMA